MDFRIRNSFDFIGRVCLASAFILVMPIRSYNLPKLINSIVDQGISTEMSTFLVSLAIIFLIGGLSLLIFTRYQKIGASILLIFLIPSVIFFQIKPNQTTLPSRNLGLIGGLIIVLIRNQPQKRFEDLINWKKILNNFNNKF